MRWAAWTILIAGVAILSTTAVLYPASWKAPLHVRTNVSETDARLVLYRTVGQVMVHGPHQLCATLGTHPASPCTTSLARAGTPPGRAPGVQCVTPIQDGPLAGAMVLTIRGQNDLGAPYLTDFVVVDAGTGPAPLDPVYWSGLHLVETSGDTGHTHTRSTTWRYDGKSTRCQ